MTAGSDDADDANRPTDTQQAKGRRGLSLRKVWRVSRSLLVPLVLIGPTWLIAIGLVIESIDGDGPLGRNLAVLAILTYAMLRILRCGVTIRGSVLVIRGYFWSRSVPINSIEGVGVGDYWGPLWSLSERFGSLELHLKDRRRPLRIAAVSGSRKRLRELKTGLTQALGLPTSYRW